MVTVMTDEASQTRLVQQQWRKLAAEREGTLLFETAGETHAGSSYLFEDPLRCLTADDETSLNELFTALSAALDAGFHVAGHLRYEAGYVFERVRNRPPVAEPLAWFGIYRDPKIIARTASSGTSLLSQPLCLSMETSLAEYLRRVAAIKQYIAAGDSYQVNLTTAVRSSYQGSVLDLYNALAEQQPAPFSALLHLPDQEVVLSLSPELFFSIDAGGTITMRPMKGTAPPGEDVSTDKKAMEWLVRDEKNRAEHLMIVDLLRSDLGRLCSPGSIRTDPLFEVEQYRTLLQMTSTITGALQATTSLREVFRALFPSGSMTGAPKPRTMELLAELENTPRGIYSGAIGFAAPSGAAVFNVAIRTAVLKNGTLRMGVGGGIVADSVAEQEHAECWLKAEFLRRASPDFGLVETLLWEDGFPLLEQHLDRLATSADQLNFKLDRAKLRQQLLDVGAEATEPCRVRVVLERSGTLTLTLTKVVVWPTPLHIKLSSENTWSGDSFLQHKTTFRPLYDLELTRARAAGFAEVIFTNKRQELTEGAISSLLVFVEDEWRTPALAAGVLPGVARSELLRSEQIQEAALTLGDLRRADALAICNAVRGIARVQSLRWNDGRVTRFGNPIELPLQGG